jgi:4-diphosphocytidyl-2-C-methyl-D-erythritol kinase
MPSHVVARVPGKINLQLSVGPLQRDGYHPVATVFQAVSIFDDVKVALSNRAGIKILSGGSRVNDEEI